MSQGLSLYDIEQGMHEALTAWQEAEGPEQLAAAELALDVYLKAEVAKVDGIRQYLRHCDSMIAAAAEEVKVQSARGQAWKDRKDRLKAFVQGVMESTGQKRLEGRNGSLLLKGNGGKQPVTISDESLVPDDMCRFQVDIDGPLWLAIMDENPHLKQDSFRDGKQAIISKRIPSLSLIGAALEKPCSMCRGTGEGDEYGISPSGNSLCHACRDCGGSGKQSVPGCRLEPRGAHVEVK